VTDDVPQPVPGVSGRGSRLTVLLQVAALALVLALLALLVLRIVRTDNGASLVASIRRGDRPAAPAFDLPVIWDRDELWPPSLRPALADGRVRLDELRGRPLVINFWASWCIPCREEAPALAASARAHAGEVAFLGLDIQDFTSDARKFLRKHDVPYVSVRDSSSGSYTAYGLTGVPETYYVDPQGRIIEHSVGAVSRRELEEQIAKIVRR
jgi:cytochrome c biogenesis protein CcmG/thiol:disulfide interchange protein DsbE